MTSTRLLSASWMDIENRSLDERPPRFDAFTVVTAGAVHLHERKRDAATTLLTVASREYIILETLTR